MPTDNRGRTTRDRAPTSTRTPARAGHTPTQKRTGTRLRGAAGAQARVHAMLQQLADERVQARLHAASRAFTQSRPGMLVQQYRGSEFHDRTKHAVSVRFRIPLATDPAPEQRRLILVSAWAGALGLVGFVVAMPVLLDLFRPAGDWYGPVMILIGMIGVGATAGAFASIHRRRAPWIGLTIGSAALILALALTLLR
jgi:hypothetical protein